MMSMAVIIILIVIIVIQKSVDISGSLHIFIRVGSLNFIGSDMVLNRMDIYHEAVLGGIVIQIIGIRRGFFCCSHGIICIVGSEGLLEYIIGHYLIRSRRLFAELGLVGKCGNQFIGSGIFCIRFNSFCRSFIFFRLFGLSFFGFFRFINDNIIICICIIFNGS